MKGGGAKAGAKRSAAVDEGRKELFEQGEWAKNDVTCERVMRSVLVYSFVKDGQSRGERADDKISVIASGQTLRAILHDHMYEEKKGGTSVGVFPANTDVIPPFTVIEVIMTAGNTKAFDEGYGVNLARVRPCTHFTLYSMMGPLGLDLAPSSYETSVSNAEASIQISPGLQKVVELKNTGFYVRIAVGAYITKYGASNDTYRLVGPKENPADPMSRHLDACAGIFAITIAKTDLLRFTNAVETEDEENGLIYAQCLLDLAASAGALSCYVVHNEYLMRKDPNGIPYTGVPLIDTNKLLEAVSLPAFWACAGGSGGEGARPRFLLPFDVVNMETPFFTVDCATIDNNCTGESGGEKVPPLPCPDMVLTSENAPVRYAYPITLGDAVDPDIMRILFVPKTHSSLSGASSSGGGGGVSAGGGCGLVRTDYRLLKRARKATPSSSGPAAPPSPPPPATPV